MALFDTNSFRIAEQGLSLLSKQQAVIEKLKQQNQMNKEEIRNLKELLKMLQDTEIQVRNDFAVA